MKIEKASDYFTTAVPRRLHIKSRHKDILVFFNLFFDVKKVLRILEFLESEEEDIRRVGMHIIKNRTTKQEKRLLADYIAFGEPRFALLNLKKLKTKYED